MRRIVLAAAAAALLMTGAPAFGSFATAAPAEAEAEAAKRKINLAGRQRMLTQRMAKAACFASIGLEAGHHLEGMATAHALFARTLDGLRHGDPEQGLTRETKDAVLAELREVEALWADYGDLVAASVESGAVSEADLADVAEQNLPILTSMNEAVQQTARAYGDSSVPLHLAVALDISGRQRMLTQKMAKEVCFVAADVQPAEARAALAETVELFSASLEALMNGAPFVGIRPPRSAELEAQLGTVAAMWEELKPVFVSVAGGAEPTARDLALVAERNMPLLREMNRAVFLYEQE